MNKPDLYRQAKKSSQIDAQQALKDFEKFFKWRTDGGDSVLDAGCGPGDITQDVLAKFLPKNFKRLVGVDISDKMINFARSTHIHPKLTFEQFNLEVALETQSLAKMEPFDHIFSFYVLMYIHDQKTCIQNFYKLLKNDGDMLISFLAQHPHYDVYKEQSQDPRWAPYMKDVDLHLSPYHFSPNPGEEFRNLLIESGFTVCDVKVHDKKIVHTLDTMQNCVHSINTFIDRIPDDEKTNYLDDLIERLILKCSVRDDVNNNNVKMPRFTLPYKLVVAYARK